MAVTAYNFKKLMDQLVLFFSLIFLYKKIKSNSLIEGFYLKLDLVKKKLKKSLQKNFLSIDYLRKTL